MWIKVAAGASVVVIAVAAVAYVSRLPAVTISNVSVSGTNMVSADSVTALVNESLRGSFAYLIPHTNALFAPTSAITSAVMKEFPQVATVSVSRPNFQTLAIAVTERSPVALWCPGIPPGEISGDEDASSTPASPGEPCFQMDGGGFIFATATPGMALTKYYGGPVHAPVGDTYLNGDFAVLSSTVSGIADSINQVPQEVLASASGTDVSVAFDSGGIVRFTRGSDKDSVLENVASVFASQSFKDHPDFEYVDFRYGDKVYVKFK